MDKAGGIIALIAGVLGIIAGFFTLFVGGLGSALDAQAGDSILSLAWAGLGLSMLAVIGGGVSLARPRPGGVTVVIASIVGIVYGGTLVALCLALALIGGGLAVLAPPRVEGVVPEPLGKRWKVLALSVLAGLAVLIAVVLLEQRGEGASIASVPASEPDELPPAALKIGDTAAGEKFAITLSHFALQPTVGFGITMRLPPAGTVFAVLPSSTLPPHFRPPFRRNSFPNIDLPPRPIFVCSDTLFPLCS